MSDKGFRHEKRESILILRKACTTLAALALAGSMQLSCSQAPPEDLSMMMRHTSSRNTRVGEVFAEGKGCQ